VIAIAVASVSGKNINLISVSTEGPAETRASHFVDTSEIVMN
jgi:hypothetical protein